MSRVWNRTLGGEKQASLPPPPSESPAPPPGLLTRAALWCVVAARPAAAAAAFIMVVVLVLKPRIALSEYVVNSGRCRRPGLLAADDVSDVIVPADNQRLLVNCLFVGFGFWGLGSSRVLFLWIKYVFFKRNFIQKFRKIYELSFSFG